MYGNKGIRLCEATVRYFYMQNGREQCKRPFRVTRSIMITDSALDFFVTFHYIILFHSILFHSFFFFYIFDGKK